jgi:hypothetical protein
VIQFTLTGDLEIQARIDHVAPRFVYSVMEAFARTNADLAGYIRDTKLGGEVLNRRTGRLADSVRVIPETVSWFPAVVTGGVEQDSSEAPYGKFHEYGARIPARFGNPVMRWTNEAGETVFATRAKGFDLPVRSFMRSALEEFMPIYESVVLAAIREGLGG